jgi:hypothetical protein
VVLDAEHRPLVSGYAFFERLAEQVLVLRLVPETGDKEERMGRGILLWLLGVPIPVIILLWLFFGH